MKRLVTTVWFVFAIAAVSGTAFSQDRDRSGRRELLGEELSLTSDESTGCEHFCPPVPPTRTQSSALLPLSRILTPDHHAS